MTYSLWLCAPWKWNRPFSSLAKPGVAVTSSSMARVATGAGAFATNDLSMSMWLIEVSVSSWAAFASSRTVTFSVREVVSSTLSSIGMGERTSICW